MIDSVLEKALGVKAAELPEVQLAYLFGSQVDGQIGPMSDYDIAILLDHDADRPRARERLAYEYSSLLQTDRVDVILLNIAPLELAYVVIAYGHLLFERTVYARVEYEAQVMSRYGDYLPVLRAQREQIMRGENYAARVQRYRKAFRRTERTLGTLKAFAKQELK